MKRANRQHSKGIAVHRLSLRAALLLVGSGALAGCAEKDDLAGMEAASEDAAVAQDRAADGGDATEGITSRQAVHLTADQERALGVVYTTAGKPALVRTIRTVGRIEPAEQRVADITPKIDGFVEDLYVSTTGESVRRGQPLLTLYSPELVAAQEELLTAKRLASRVDEAAEEAWRNAQSMLEAARRRLLYWDITAEQIERLESTEKVTKTLRLVSPVNGIVLEKIVLQGQRVSPGQLLYRLADLSEVWVEGDVFEQDLQFIEPGAQSHIEVSAYPGEHLMGRVSFIYPTVDVESRTNRVRITLANPDLRLKPGMFATIFFDVVIGGDAVAIPVEAVLVTGERNLVFVRDEDGMLQPREVVLGAQAQDYVQILSGLAQGEVVVGSANFLVDAESRLAGTGGDMPGMQHAGHGSVVEPDEGQSDVSPKEKGVAPGQDEHQQHQTPETGPGAEHD